MSESNVIRAIKESQLTSVLTEPLRAAELNVRSVPEATVPVLVIAREGLAGKRLR